MRCARCWIGVISSRHLVHQYVNSITHSVVKTKQNSWNTFDVTRMYQELLLSFQGWEIVKYSQIDFPPFCPVSNTGSEVNNLIMITYDNSNDRKKMTIKCELSSVEDWDPPKIMHRTISPLWRSSNCARAFSVCTSFPPPRNEHRFHLKAWAFICIVFRV